MEIKILKFYKQKRYPKYFTCEIQVKEKGDRVFEIELNKSIIEGTTWVDIDALLCLEDGFTDEEIQELGDIIFDYIRTKSKFRVQATVENWEHSFYK